MDYFDPKPHWVILDDFIRFLLAFFDIDITPQYDIKVQLAAINSKRSSLKPFTGDPRMFARLSRPMLAIALLVFGMVGLSQATTVPVATNFNGYGTNVSGYQDFFNSTTFNSGWQESVGGAALSAPGTHFSLPGDGTLHVNAANGDPNKLLYNGASYNATNQTVLAMIEFVNPLGANNDGWRAGIGVAATSGDSYRGIDGLFRQDGNNEATINDGVHANMLNDGAAWGPELTGSGGLTAGTFYWLELKSDGTNVGAKIWAADSITPEPSVFQATMSLALRSGLAGIVGNSGGVGNFQVNYVLIEASGLPQVAAGVPEPGSCVLLALGTVGLIGYGVRRHRSRSGERML